MILVNWELAIWGSFSTEVLFRVGIDRLSHVCVMLAYLNTEKAQQTSSSAHLFIFIYFIIIIFIYFFYLLLFFLTSERFFDNTSIVV